MYIFNNLPINIKMLTESLTIGFIIGICGLVAWLAKNKFQPEIEEDIKRREQNISTPLNKIKKN